MSEITVIGLDLAKHVFQVHGADPDGRPVLRKRLRRGQVLEFFASLSPCLIGMEACAGSHYWGRELQALGHEVRLIPPQYVKPYVKTNKNDATDAEAISEALTRPTMRFTAVKSAEQQSVLMLHRTRELLVRQRTMLGEFGIVAAKGLSCAGDLIKRIEDPADTALPDLPRQALQCLTSQIRAIQEQIALIEKKLLAWHSSCEASRRLAEIPGVGLITATAVVASVGNATQFRSARQFAAWLGLVPQQHSSGGKQRLGHISKRGDGYIRRLLVHGARAHLSWSRRKKQIRSAWLTGLLARRPTNVVLLAMANKTARIAWAMLSRGERYQEMIAAAA